MGKRLLAGDPPRGHGRAEPPAGERHEVAAQALAWLEPGAEDDERLHPLPHHRVRDADDRRLDDGRVLHEGTFHLERADEVAR